MNIFHSTTPLEMDLFYRIDINLFPLFVAIYEHQNISKAAYVLHISQSAVSHALQKLRHHFNDDLFIRASGKMNPTPFAEQIYPKLKNALIEIQNISINNEIFNPKEIKNIKLAIHDEIEPIIMPKLVQHFQNIGLNIQFLSYKLDRKTLETDLATQQIDFAIDLEQSINSQLLFKPLLQDHFVVCSQLQEMNESIYLSSPHIGVSSRRIGLFIEDIFLSKKRYSRNIFLRCQNYSTALQLLEQFPNAVLTLPSYVLNHSQISQHIFIHKVPVELPKISIGVFSYLALRNNERLSFLSSEIYNIFT